MTLPFLSMPCSQTPPDSPATIAFIGRLLLPSRYSTLSASGCSCHEAQSLHLRYGLDIALSTLNSCRHLHEPKTRFPVGRLIPFPGRESHPLKAPGLAWRTEKLFQIKINHPAVAFGDILLRLRHRLMRRTLRTKPVTVLGERRVPSALQNLHHRLLDKPVQHRRDAQLAHPSVRLGDFYSPHRLRLISPAQQ